ncbi:DUF4400 domain-containing protein [Cupriavidus basilensis]|uniref:DUF4400 domain-containing protein n=1 Tax=Cupriavidus basilensis TaxID=68895 RepID=UPI00075191B4|nr:DUF4400 domain-containing protein [Cupriavidus basilensis]
MASKFASHIRLWLLATPLVLCVAAPMLRDDSVFEIGATEQESVAEALGEHRADQATKAANDRFDRWFVQSGAMKFSFSGSDVRTQFSDGGAADIGRRWVRHLWLSVYRGVYRASVAGYWLFGSLVFLAALLNDGAVARRIKAASAGFANPVSFHVAAHGLLLCFGITSSAMFVPVPLLAYWWNGAVGVAGFLCWRLASSFHVGR